jgi:hypothetical protein
MPSFSLVFHHFILSECDPPKQVTLRSLVDSSAGELKAALSFCSLVVSFVALPGLLSPQFYCLTIQKAMTLIKFSLVIFGISKMTLDNEPEPWAE